MSRHVKVILGEGRSEFESEVADFRQIAIAYLRAAAPFAVAQFSVFCKAVIEQFKH